MSRIAELEKKRDQVAEQLGVAQKQEESQPVARKRRNTFNGTEAKLNVRQQIPGYHLHIFTDSGSRVQEALDGGWEFVTPDEIGGVSENVVSRNGDLGERIRYLVNPRTGEGSDKFGYLMKIRQEWYEEDQAALQAKNSQIDAAIRKGKITGDNASFYVPQNGISVKS